LRVRARRPPDPGVRRGRLHGQRPRQGVGADGRRLPARHRHAARPRAGAALAPGSGGAVNGARVWREIDWVAVLLAALLALVGLLFIDSATRDPATGNSSAGRHAILLVTSAVLGVGVVATHYGRVMRAAVVLYVLALLGLLLLPWFGIVVNGARRWYRLPGGFALQPAEFAKLALIVVI